MTNALHPHAYPAEPTPPPSHGVAARCLRRFAGTLRRLVAGGIALTTNRRRPPPVEAATPPRPKQKRRSRTAAPAVPPAGAARLGWLARRFGRVRQHPAAPLPSVEDIRYTPETHPHLTAEICDVLNTPLEACDPEILCGALAIFAEQLAMKLPAELGLDAQTLFSELWGQMGGLEGAAPPDLPPSEPPAPQDVAPPAPPRPPDPADAAPAGDTTHPATPGAAVSALRRAPARGAASRRLRRRVRCDGSPASRHSHRSRRNRGHPRRRMPSGPHQSRARQLCYAARASPS